MYIYIKYVHLHSNKKWFLQIRLIYIRINVQYAWSHIEIWHNGIILVPSLFPLSHISLLFPLSPILPSIDLYTHQCIAQPIANRVSLDLGCHWIVSKNFQFSTKRTRILIGFIFYYLVLIVNHMGRILVRWMFFKNNLEIQCHPICNRLYAFDLTVAPFWFKMYTYMHV